MNLHIKNLFLTVSDPRLDRTKKHPLESILYLVLCAVMTGVDSWIGMQDYAQAHLDTLSKFIDFPNGVPSHDTISRVIEALDVEEFSACFEAFTQKLAPLAQNLICIDGKTMRGSHDLKKGIKPRHIVSAWASGCKLVLGQEKVDDKSNEITAIPELLKRLDLQGRVVTIDAMGCQREICQQIVEQEGDYVICLKGNQGNLHKNVALWFEDSQNPPDHVWDEWDKGHGRIEHRLCRATADIAWLQEIHRWPGLTSIAVVEAMRETATNGVQKEKRYYISSLGANAEMIARAARDHWGIENALHWVLDVTMNEDQSRIRSENAPEVLSLMRKWGLNLINKHKGKISVKRMIQKMAMSPKILLQILQHI